jgi:hypothetical protein
MISVRLAFTLRTERHSRPGDGHLGSRHAVANPAGITGSAQMMARVENL